MLSQRAPKILVEGSCLQFRPGMHRDSHTVKSEMMCPLLRVMRIFEGKGHRCSTDLGIALLGSELWAQVLRKEQS